MKLNSITTHSFFALTLSLLGVGCGESVQGTYVGDNVIVSTVPGDQNCSLESGNDFIATVDLQLSGNEVSITMRSIARNGQTSSQSEKVLTGYAANGSLQSGDVRFNAVKTWPDGLVIGDRTQNAAVSGNLMPDRTQITNLHWVYQGFVGTTPCSLAVDAATLNQR